MRVAHAFFTSHAWYSNLAAFAFWPEHFEAKDNVVMAPNCLRGTDRHGDVAEEVWRSFHKLAACHHVSEALYSNFLASVNIQRLR